MLSFQLKEVLSTILDSHQEASNLYEALDIIKKWNELIREELEKIASEGDSNKVTQIAPQIRRLTDRLKHQLVSTRPRLIFLSLDNIQEVLKSAIDSSGDESNELLHLYAMIEEFSAVYEDFIQNRDASSPVKLLYSSTNLLSYFNGFMESTRFCLQNLEATSNCSVTLGSLSILLADLMTPKQFAYKLIALNEIYEELIAIKNISIIDYPLSIRKIESGSFWANLSGHPLVMKIIGGLIEKSAHYLYSTYSIDGQFKAIPTKIEAIESILGVAEKLELSGIEASEIKEELTKATLKIAQNLNSLLEDQPKVNVNGKEISVGEEINNKLLASEKILQLGHDKKEE